VNEGVAKNLAAPLFFKQSHDLVKPLAISATFANTVPVPATFSVAGTGTHRVSDPFLAYHFSLTREPRTRGCGLKKLILTGKRDRRRGNSIKRVKSRQGKSAAKVDMSG
jgi:hypothetical protein